MPSLVRLKSTMRYCLRYPPPLWRVVMWPLLLRPECFFLTSSSERSGAFFETSLKSAVVMKRRAALVGLYFLTAILLLEVVHAAQLDLLAGREGDDGFFPVGLHAAGALAAAREVLLLAADVDRVDLHDGHAEDLRHGRLDLRLGRPRVHFEAVLLHDRARHRLLGDQRRNDDVPRFHYFDSLVYLPTSASWAAVVSTTRA